MRITINGQQAIKFLNTNKIYQSPFRFIEPRGSIDYEAEENQGEPECRACEATGSSQLWHWTQVAQNKLTPFEEIFRIIWDFLMPYNPEPYDGFVRRDTKKGAGELLINDGYPIPLPRRPYIFGQHDRTQRGESNIDGYTVIIRLYKKADGEFLSQATWNTDEMNDGFEQIIDGGLADRLNQNGFGARKEPSNIGRSAADAKRLDSEKSMVKQKHDLAIWAERREQSPYVGWERDKIRRIRDIASSGYVIDDAGYWKRKEFETGKLGGERRKGKREPWFGEKILTPSKIFLVELSKTLELVRVLHRIGQHEAAAPLWVFLGMPNKMHKKLRHKATEYVNMSYQDALLKCQEMVPKEEKFRSKSWIKGQLFRLLMKSPEFTHEGKSAKEVPAELRSYMRIKNAIDSITGNKIFRGFGPPEIMRRIGNRIAVRYKVHDEDARDNPGLYLLLAAGEIWLAREIFDTDDVDLITTLMAEKILTREEGINAYRIAADNNVRLKTILLKHPKYADKASRIRSMIDVNYDLPDKIWNEVRARNIAMPAHANLEMLNKAIELLNGISTDAKWVTEAPIERDPDDPVSVENTPLQQQYIDKAIDLLKEYRFKGYGMLNPTDRKRLNRLERRTEELQQTIERDTIEEGMINKATEWRDIWYTYFNNVAHPKSEKASSKDQWGYFMKLDRSRIEFELANIIIELIKRAINERWMAWVSGEFSTYNQITLEPTINISLDGLFYPGTQGNTTDQLNEALEKLESIKTEWEVEELFNELYKIYDRIVSDQRKKESAKVGQEKIDRKCLSRHCANPVPKRGFCNECLENRKKRRKKLAKEFKPKKKGKK